MNYRQPKLNRVVIAGLAQSLPPQCLPEVQCVSDANCQQGEVCVTFVGSGQSFCCGSDDTEIPFP